MRKAWALIKDEIPWSIPWICCLPCVPHVVLLLMKDIAKIPEVAKVIADDGPPMRTTRESPGLELLLTTSDFSLAWLLATRVVLVRTSAMYAVCRV